MASRIVTIGTSHQHAPVEEREKIAVDGDGEGPIVHALLEPGVVDEAVVLSTCNRVEITVAGPDEARARQHVERFISSRVGGGQDWLEKYTYTHAGKHAIRHVFRVASSLDSLVLGEPQILGQVKQAYKAALEAGGTGPVLNRLFEKASFVGKRVRTETSIGENAVSVSFAAVELARKVFGNLDGKRVLVIGAGKMGALAVRHLRAHGASEVRIMNRTPERAQRLAQTLGGSAHGLDELTEQLAQVDIVISSTGSQHYVVKHQDVKRAASKRKYKPLFMIDIAVPRDIDPRCDQVGSVYLFDMDDLEKVVEANKEARRFEADRAEDIVLRETKTMEAWMAEAEVVPTIVGLRSKLTALKEEELEKLRKSHPDLDPAAMQAVEKMAHTLINKVLHEPTVQLRRASTREHAPSLVAAARSLFALNEEATDSTPPKKAKPLA